MIDDFMESLEGTFGNYKHGMRSAIEDKISGLSDNGFADLLKYLTENYDMARPPSLKVILGECYRYNIELNRQNLYGVSVCEFCSQEFSQNELNCPKCQKLRKYGLTKLVKYKPGWIDREKAEELKAKLEWEERIGQKKGENNGIFQ